jgi:hypothetical protein
MSLNLILREYRNCIFSPTNNKNSFYWGFGGFLQEATIVTALEQSLVEVSAFNFDLFVCSSYMK